MTKEQNIKDEVSTAIDILASNIYGSVKTLPPLTKQQEINSKIDIISYLLSDKIDHLRDIDIGR